jgi:hypothetical protein
MALLLYVSRHCFSFWCEGTNGARKKVQRLALPVAIGETRNKGRFSKTTKADA